MNEYPHSSSDEITLKELILKIKEYVGEVIKFWWIIIFLSLIFAAGFYFMHTKHEPIYRAELRFVVEGQSGGGGGLSSLLGSFGIKKGGKINRFKIIEVGKSTKLLLEVLSEVIESEDNIANDLLNEYNLVEKWSESNIDFENFRFEERINNSGNRLERKAIKKLRTIVWGNENTIPLTSFNIDDETGIYIIATETKSEEMSLKITNVLYDKIKLFFEEEVFLNQKQLADILTLKADSIKTLNESKVWQLAKFEDRNRGSISNQSMVTRLILSQENLALSSAYAEVLKNKEMTDVNLKDMQPLFMAIDTPFSPIVPSSSSGLMAIIKGIVLGGFICVLFILLKKIYRDIMIESDI